jgi:hypothetical protein
MIHIWYNIHYLFIVNSVEEYSLYSYGVKFYFRFIFFIINIAFLIFEFDFAIRMNFLMILFKYGKR